MESFEIFNPNYRSPWRDHWIKVASSFLIGLGVFILILLFFITDFNFRLFSGFLLLVVLPLAVWSVFIRDSSAFPKEWAAFITQKGDSPVLPSAGVKSIKVHANFNLSTELCEYISSQQRAGSQFSSEDIWLKVAELYRIRNLESCGQDVSELTSAFKASLHQ